MAGSLRLLALDIDGTLLRSDKTISPRTRAAVDGARERGVQVVLVTGRRHPSARRVADDLGGGVPLVLHNGALVIEDGPTTTHGGRPHGAGYAAALAAGAEVVDPHPYAVPAIAAVYAAYPHVGPVLPAVGYDDAQLAALAGTIAAVPCEAVVLATPGDIGALISIRQPVMRCGYEFADPDGAIGGWVGEALAARGIVPG